MKRFPTTFPLLFAAGAALSACSDGRSPTAPAAPSASADESTSGSNQGSEVRGFTSIDMPHAAGTFPLDINAGGVIVGRYSSAGQTHGFLRSATGELTTIDFPGSVFTVAAGISSRGDVVGMYALPGALNRRHGYLLRDGVFTTIDPAGSNWTNVLGINDRGDVVGRFCTLATCRATGNGDFRGFLLRDGEFTTIDFPGASETNAWKINDRGEIVGGFGMAGSGGQLFVLAKGEFTAIALHGAPPVSQDNGGINARGDVVGLYCDGAPPCQIVPTGTHGFLISEGHLTTIDVPGALATSAIGINARREIVGGYYDAHGSIHGYLLSSDERADDGQSEQPFH